MFALEAEDYLWEILSETVEARRFVKYLLKDFKFDCLKKSIYKDYFVKKQNNNKKLRFNSQLDQTNRKDKTIKLSKKVTDH